MLPDDGRDEQELPIAGQQQCFQEQDEVGLLLCCRGLLYPQECKNASKKGSLFCGANEGNRDVPPILTPGKQRKPISNSADVLRNTFIISFSYTRTQAHMQTHTGFVLNPAGMI